MSKWHKVYFPGNHFNDMTEVGDFLRELKPEGRWKVKPFINGNGNYWCFKFKDEIAAMAFKLRWC